MFDILSLAVSLLTLFSTNSEDPSVSPYPPHDPDQWPLAFDFVIVGAGTAGSIVASRLAEVAEWKILLVEAGGDPLNISYFPENRDQLYQSAMDWNFVTEEQDGMFLSLLDKKTRIPSGKGLGGTSSIHSLFYTRGDSNDYDDWGYDVFKFDNILKYFKKSEFMTDISKVNEFHGTQGPLVIRPSPRVDIEFETVGKVCEELYKTKRLYDINTGSTLGYSHYDLYMDSEGHRVSSYTAYLKNRNKKNHHNLYVLKNSEAVRLILKEHETPDKPASSSDLQYDETNENVKDNGFASLSIDDFDSNSVKSDVDTIDEQKLKIGTVEIRIGNVTSGKVFRPKILKEIILSAGTINTPKILLNSGIGPADQFHNKSIHQVKTLPVGHNYWDHVHISGLLFKTKDEAVAIPTRYGGGAGILMSLLGDPARPNIEYQVSKISKGTPARKVIHNLNNPVVESQLNSILAEYNVIQIKPSLLRPNSRGRVILGENPTKDPPRIRGGYLRDPEDVFVLVDAIMKAEQLQNSPEFKKNGFVPIILDYSPTCNSTLHSLDPKLYWMCTLSHIASSNWHPMGTCKLGEVVDGTLLVESFENLRIADASVIPVMSGHPNAAVVMLAEYISDIITARYTSSAVTPQAIFILITIILLVNRLC